MLPKSSLPDAIMKKESVLVVSFQSLTARSAAAIGQLGYKLSEELHSRSSLKAFVVSSKGKFKTVFQSHPVSVLSKYYLYLINNFAKGLAPHKSRYLQEYLYDLCCALHIDRTITKLVVTTPYLYRTFKRAKKLGIRIYFIPGNPEDNYIARLVNEENERYNIREDDAYTYKKRLNYYNKSLPLIDKVITFSSVMESSYRKAGYGDKIIDLRGYLKPEEPTEELKDSKPVAVFKVSFLAYVVLLKGLQYVLEAWKDLQNEGMELHIGGVIDTNVQTIIDENYSDLQNVYYHGKISDVHSFFKDKSVYILPSLIDGAPVSVLEAMQNGVVPIVSENCGTKDILEDGASGWIVPTKSSECIKSKVLEAFHNREKTREMGEYARSRISSYDMDTFARTLADKIINDDN
jgi:glycosyltransferase involved in cell wall biosynthesis